MNPLKLLLTCLISLTIVCPAFAAADGAKKDINARQKNQRARIKQGVKSGELTKKEAHRLKHQQKKIQKAKKKALANDGKIDEKEKMKIQKKQNKASHAIYRNKHDKLKAKKKK